MRGVTKALPQLVDSWEPLVQAVDVRIAKREWAGHKAPDLGRSEGARQGETHIHEITWTLLHLCEYGRQAAKYEFLTLVGCGRAIENVEVGQRGRSTRQGRWKISFPTRDISRSCFWHWWSPPAFLSRRRSLLDLQVSSRRPGTSTSSR